MIRILTLVVAVLAMAVALPGCSDDSSGNNAAAELGQPEGRRPRAAEKHAPPGPGEGGAYGQSDSGQTPPPPSKPGGDSTGGG